MPPQYYDFVYIPTVLLRGIFSRQRNIEIINNPSLPHRRHVSQGVRDQHPAVLVLHSLEQLEHAVLHVGHQHGLLRGGVALPPAADCNISQGEIKISFLFSFPLQSFWSMETL